MVWPPSAVGGQLPSEIGRWQLATTTPTSPVHAALLRTGRVWLASGSGLDPDMFEAREFHSYVWDPRDSSLKNIATPWDVFCAGHSFLADGRLLLAGGTAAYQTSQTARDWKGSRLAYAFNPLTESYQRLPNLADGRWYPTLVTLGSGRVFAIAGIDRSGLRMNTIPEIYVPGRRVWKTKPETPPWPTYPALVLTRDGRLLNTGGKVDPTLDMAPGLLDVQTSKLTPVPGLSLANRREQSATVLLPPAQRQRVMIVGGGSVTADAHGRVDIVDLGKPVPAFEPAAPLNHPRMHISAVLLPDRTVLVTGGGRGLERDPVLAAESYSPAADEWRVLASASVARLYHSFALLLPDGRVLVGGSQPGGVGGHDAEMRLELYSPPYLFRGTRPVIRQAPDAVTYGASVRIESTQSAGVKWVSLIRPSAVTHSTDTEQRLVNVPFRRLKSGRLQLSITAQRNIAPPGWYMLFVTNSSGVPSVARWVHLT